MSRQAVHFITDYRHARDTRCGKEAFRVYMYETYPHFRYERVKVMHADQLTCRWAKVTCKACLKLKARKK